MGETKSAGPIIPPVGYGTWQRNGDEARRCVRAALETGYRHIDTAELYGNETEVGEAIADSPVDREAIFVTTKVSPENLGPGQVRPHVEASLARLGMDRVDLLLVHWPSIGDRYDLRDYVSQFAAVQDAGLARHIGVSNFTRRHIDQAVEVLGASRITTNQCEIHVLMQNRRIVDHCRERGIPMTAYCPLARGEFLQNPVLAEIARTRHATVGQVGLAFLLAEGHIIIPSSSNTHRIAENFAAAEVRLSPDEIEAIRALDAGRRLVNGAWSPEWDT